MTKTMSIRMDKENFEFVSQLSKQGKGDISKTVRDLIYKGRVLLAIEKYKKTERLRLESRGSGRSVHRRHDDHP